jgi:16S rRNA (adenine1518-N6/adenine1519-N6)-dimethyltransferase
MRSMPGQTLREIRALLAAAGLSPQHRFGQNFLHDLNLLRKLVDAAEVAPADVVLEVGPGTGSLTELLLDRGARVVAVEIDRGLQALLRQRLESHANISLLQADALDGKHRVNPLVLQALGQQTPGPGGHRKLVANLPYQIATPLLVDLLIGEPKLERLACTIQREVGERLSAQPKTEQYGPVSVLVQLLARVEVLAILPPQVFWPAPKVESIMLVVFPRPAAEIGIHDVAGFSRFVHEAFVQRRKMLRRLVKDWPPAEGLAAFSRAGVSPDSRPEELSPTDWRLLYRELRQAVPTFRAR